MSHLRTQTSLAWLQLRRGIGLDLFGKGRGPSGFAYPGLLESMQPSSNLASQLHPLFEELQNTNVLESQ
jgi:hypothetical protein